ncbi:MAG: hypothetical protein P1U40_01370 [Coxiellaceae bacterium]|nr:hypothetical protein [Coxiellaceae bacterium]
MSITAIGKVSTFVISMVASVLLLVPLSGYFAEAKKTIATKTSLNKISNKLGSTSTGVFCSPSTESTSNGACKLPDFSIGLMVFLNLPNLQAGSNVLQTYKSSSAAALEVNWSIYLGGVCTLNYDPTKAGNCKKSTLNNDFCIRCLHQDKALPNSTLSPEEQITNLNKIIAIESWYPNNTKYYIGIEFGADAVKQIAKGASFSKDAADAVSNTLFPQGVSGTNLNAAGVFLDIESGAMLSQEGADFANALSIALPNSKSINIFAAKAGQTDKNNVASGYKEKYEWSFWPALNRSVNTSCVNSDNPCHMGVMIPSIYDSGSLTIGFAGKNLVNDPIKGTTTFNVGIIDFPYQMKLISNFAYQVGSDDYLQPVSVASRGATISAPFGYYQLGLGASATAGNSPSYGTFDSPVVNTDKYLKSVLYWGAANSSSPNPSKAMPYTTMQCGGKYANVKNCASYRQQEQVPNEKAGTYYKLSDIMNQYVCAQLNAVTYIYSNRSLQNTPKTFCNIYNRYYSGGYGEDQNTPFFYDNALNQVYPYAQEGYGVAMRGVAFYQITDSKASLLDTCYAKCAKNFTNCNSGTGFQVSSSCLLIPSFYTIWNAGNNSTWDMILDWIGGNVKSPSVYIKHIPGYGGSNQE